MWYTTKITVFKEAYDLFYRIGHPAFKALTCPTEAFGECNLLVLVYYRFIFWPVIITLL